MSLLSLCSTSQLPHFHSYKIFKFNFFSNMNCDFCDHVKIVIMGTPRIIIWKKGDSPATTTINKKIKKHRNREKNILYWLFSVFVLLCVCHIFLLLCVSLFLLPPKKKSIILFVRMVYELVHSLKIIMIKKTHIKWVGDGLCGGGGSLWSNFRLSSFFIFYSIFNTSVDWRIKKGS